MTKPSQPVLDQFFINWCHLNSISNVFVSDSISSCMPTNPTQYTHLSDTHCWTTLMSSFRKFPCIQKKSIISLAFHLFKTNTHKKGGTV
jgi:hypothetical protein